MGNPNMDDSTLLSPPFYRPAREGHSLHQQVTAALLAPIQGGPTPSKMFSRSTRLRYPPRAMHAAYVAKDKGVVGRVNWQFLPRALKSFTGHYWSGPTTIGFTRRVGKPESRLMKKQRRPQETTLFSNPHLCTY